MTQIFLGFSSSCVTGNVLDLASSSPGNALILQHLPTSPPQQQTRLFRGGMVLRALSLRGIDWCFEDENKNMMGVGSKKMDLGIGIDG